MFVFWGKRNETYAQNPEKKRQILIAMAEELYSLCVWNVMHYMEVGKHTIFIAIAALLTYFICLCLNLT